MESIIQRARQEIMGLMAAMVMQVQRVKTAAKFNLHQVQMQPAVLREHQGGMADELGMQMT
ncbi:hypothetical protein VY86_14230 [Photorhabdus thracensis]|uniref:Uncharacterized protein n=1 Tax=Photorhabdus thracensis TaxID=230089 RepID=A0A0F7LRB7_9GAMM|nr:hypothetical protein VY86_14230 [Photorhabdus thracensis]